MTNETGLSETEKLKDPEDGANADDGEFDQSKVKFINVNGTSETHINVSPDELKDPEFAGLTKEELMKYANDPKWVKIRWAVLIIFWVIWFVMLLAAILIIVFSPKCPPRPNLNWLESSVAYQIYPRSFKDSNDDGNGDIQGIEQKLDHIQELQATVVSLGSIYEYEDAGIGNDIVSHTTIDSTYGTMEDFDQLLNTMHRKGMKMILDFIPNYTSKNHTWFLESAKGSSNYSDYYIWHDGKNGGADFPNNWLSVYGGPAWTKDTTRNQYYLHQFLPEQPDLNLRNPDVLKELEEILNFWLDKKVDGFKVIAAPYLIESLNFEDETVHNGSGAEYDDMEHTHTMYQNETFELLIRWKKILEAKTNVDPNYYRALIVEASGSLNDISKLYEYNGTQICDMPTYKNLDLNKDMSGAEVMESIVTIIDAKPKDKGWYSWVLDDSDHRRTASAIEDNNINVVNMIHLTLPGTPFLYYGSEIGMKNGELTTKQLVDRIGEKDGVDASRDPERTPMQWTNEKNAGFSAADKTWLPVNQDYINNNVKTQLAHGIDNSNIQVVKDLAKLKLEPSFQWGEFGKVALQSNNILAFVRQAEGFEGFLVAVNYGPIDDVADFTSSAPDLVPSNGIIYATTQNFDSHGRAQDFELGTTVKLDNIHIKTGEGVIFKWPVEDIPV